jgi:hypothetical protein
MRGQGTIDTRSPIRRNNPDFGCGGRREHLKMPSTAQTVFAAPSTAFGAMDIKVKTSNP